MEEPKSDGLLRLFCGNFGYSGFLGWFHSGGFIRFGSFSWINSVWFFWTDSFDWIHSVGLFWGINSRRAVFRRIARTAASMAALAAALVPFIMNEYRYGLMPSGA